MKDKLKRIAELHDRWDDLSHEESRELIELKNSIEEIKKADFEGFRKIVDILPSSEELVHRSNNMGGICYPAQVIYHKDCDKEK
jgi:hypothetical protein